jgi:hypothetical protein
MIGKTVSHYKILERRLARLIGATTYIDAKRETFRKL